MTPSPNSLVELQSAIGYSFKDISYLALALCHKSAGQPNNERLEFLGDAMLGAIVAEALYNNPSFKEEGGLTVGRSNVVNGKALTLVAQSLSLESRLRLGKGERQTGKIKDSILEDAMEAIIGAVFLDSDFDTTRDVVVKLLGNKLADLEGGEIVKDSKTELQELMQSQKCELPSYRVVETEGPPHNRLFTVACRVSMSSEETLGQAGNRRAAEQAAAKAMLEALNDE